MNKLLGLVLFPFEGSVGILDGLVLGLFESTGEVPHLKMRRGLAGVGGANASLHGLEGGFHLTNAPSAVHILAATDESNRIEYYERKVSETENQLDAHDHAML